MYFLGASTGNDENIGELVFETLLNSRIDSITDLNFGKNFSWFQHPKSKEEQSGNVNHLAEFISMQAEL